jgi:hypothetical protein
MRRQSQRANIAERIISEIVAEERGIPITVVREDKRARRESYVAFAVKRHITIATARFIINSHHDPDSLSDEQIKSCADYLAEVKESAKRARIIERATAHADEVGPA